MADKIDGGIINIGINVDLGPMESGFKQAEKLTKEAGDNLKKVTKQIEENYEKTIKTGEKMKKVGTNLTKYVTLPLVAMGTAAVAEAIRFESSFAGVQKTVNGTAEQIEALRKGIINMSKEIPSSTHEISAVAEAAGQLGIKTESILDFTRVIIDLGNATNIVGEEGASQLAKFANITGMSQQSFDRLGSTIVALGNNLATTERDIVNMSMRLAGAGAQVGMTEADILSLSGALSSVGIEAEAGGSAFSKVMIEMQLAAETGNGQLKNFAKVAGMSAKEFAKAYKEDATGALLMFIEGLGKSEERGVSAIKVLDDMEIKEVRLRDALLRAANASDLFSDAVGIGNKAWEENNALTNEAAQRYATTESQLKIQKNRIQEVGRELGVKLLPILEKGMNILSEVLDYFDRLDDSQKEQIIKWGMMAAAAGPALKIIGGAVSTFGAVGKAAAPMIAKMVVGKASVAGAVTAAGTAAGTAGGAAGMGALASGLGAAALAAAPYVLAGAAVVGTGKLIYDNLTEEVVPAVDLFADEVTRSTDTVGGQTASLAGTVETSVVKISDATKEAIQAYIDLDNKATSELNELYGSGQKITADIVADMTTQFGTMSQTIIDGYTRQKEESVAQLTDMFSKSNTLTASEQAKILGETSSHYEQKKNVAQEAESRINEILNKASTEKRSLTAKEVQEINRMQYAMKDAAVQALSQTEVEARAIQSRLSADKNRINAKGAAEYISKLNQVRDESVTAANDEYKKRVETIVRMRDELGVISDDQAKKLIRSAEIQKEGTIKAAEDTRVGAIDKFRKLYGDLDKNVDTQTGEILGKFDKMKRWWNGWKPETKAFNATITTRQQSVTQGSGKSIQNYAKGTRSFEGGLTTLHERGYEVYDLPQGTRIFPHEASQDIVEETVNRLANQYIAGNEPRANQNLLANIGQMIQGALAGTSGHSSGPIELVVNLDGKMIARQIEPSVSEIQGKKGAFNQLSYGRG